MWSVGRTLVGAVAVGAFCVAAGAQESVPGTVTCESQSGGKMTCLADTSGGVALMSQTGTESCLLGKTWGYNDSRIWVAGGCSGTFALGESVKVEDRKPRPEFLRKFEPYTRLRGQLSFFDDEAEIQDSASWIGLKFATGADVKFVAHVEFGLNLIGGVDPFQAGVRTDSGFLTGESLDDPPVLASRLGYVGVDFGAGGRIHLGKDRAQHYEIASFTTDRWNSFGGQGSLAYPGFGDGGASGTGRADQIVNYNVTLADRVDLGAQVQFSNSANDESVDGYGGSLQFTIVDGLKIGGAYTQTEIEKFTQGEILGVDGDAEYGILGISYSSDRLYAGAVFSTQENGDARQVPVLEDDMELLAPVVFDGDGVEVWIRGVIGDWGISGGYVDYQPEADNLAVVDLIDADFQTKYFTLGLDWAFSDNVYLWAEFRIDSDTVSFDGVTGPDVAVIGIHYQASWLGPHDP